jgi:hypothetical protein
MNYLIHFSFKKRLKIGNRFRFVNQERTVKIDAIDETHCKTLFQRLFTKSKILNIIEK